jgi:hypothetical protein
MLTSHQTVMTFMIALFAIVAAVSGIAVQDLYSSVPAHLMPGTISQDIVTLIAGFGLVWAWRSARRGSPAAALIWLGLIGHIAYAYGIYAFEGVYNTLYLVYVAIFGLCLYSAILLFALLDKSAFKAIDRTALPRRPIAIALILLATMFLVLWLSIIIPAMVAGQKPEGATIFVFDLAFVLPLLVIAAILTWRGHWFGDLLAPALLVKVGVLGSSVLLGALIAPWFGGSSATEEIAVYTLMGPACLALAIWALVRLRSNQTELDA